MMSAIARGAVNPILGLTNAEIVFIVSPVTAEKSESFVPSNLLVSTYVGSAHMTKNPVVLNLTNHVVQNTNGQCLACHRRLTHHVV